MQYRFNSGSSRLGANASNVLASFVELKPDAPSVLMTWTLAFGDEV